MSERKLSAPERRSLDARMGIFDWATSHADCLSGKEVGRLSSLLDEVEAAARAPFLKALRPLAFSSHQGLHPYRDFDVCSTLVCRRLRALLALADLPSLGGLDRG